MKTSLKAPAKINLYLKVNNRRKDGYHDLTMVMQSISLFDIMEIEIINKNDFKKIKIFSNMGFDLKKQVNIKCNYNFIPTDDRNLIIKIIKYIYSKYNIEDYIYIYLKKMIPTGGGLGGGSSDAATILLFLNNYYKLKLSKNELVNIAIMFGSDIPFFIYKSECICEGKGEIISELKSFKNYYIVIATPNIRVSTKEIFSKVDDIIKNDNSINQKIIAYNNILVAIKSKNLYLLSNNLYNDLEEVTILNVPSILDLKKYMDKFGALNSMMSGSGPTVFGIFDSYMRANYCKRKLKSIFPDAFIYLCKPIY